MDRTRKGARQYGQASTRSGPNVICPLSYRKLLGPSRVQLLGYLENVVHLYSIVDVEGLTGGCLGPDGRVYGLKEDPAGTLRAAVWDKGQVSILADAPVTREVSGVNTAGQVLLLLGTDDSPGNVGVWDNGNLIETGLSSASSFNDHGHIAGQIVKDGALTGCIWTPDGLETFRDFKPDTINNAGHVGGTTRWIMGQARMRIGNEWTEPKARGFDLDTVTSISDSGDALVKGSRLAPGFDTHRAKGGGWWVMGRKRRLATGVIGIWRRQRFEPIHHPAETHFLCRMGSPGTILASVRDPKGRGRDDVIPLIANGTGFWLLRDLIQGSISLPWWLSINSRDEILIARRDDHPVLLRPLAEEAPPPHQARKPRFFRERWRFDDRAIARDHGHAVRV